MMKGIKTVTVCPAFDLHYRLDRFEVGRENSVTSAVKNAGGKGINTSRSLTVNGVVNTAYVFLGKQNSEAFEDELKKESISYVPFYSEGRIRENITLHHGGETRISLEGFTPDGDMLSALEARMLADGVEDSFVSFAGRIPKGLSVASVKAFLKQLKAAGAKLILDSQSFLPMELREIGPYLIKPNEQEIGELYGRESGSLETAAKSARDLARAGISEQVMISLGARGAVWSDGDRCLAVRVPSLTGPISTIGAGDSVIAGYLAGCAAQYDIEKTLALAAAYGTAACMREGTLPPLPRDVRSTLQNTLVFGI
jgi:1-phosphofructokinase/6-phosphofructokinase 2